MRLLIIVGDLGGQLGAASKIARDPWGEGRRRSADIDGSVPDAMRRPRRGRDPHRSAPGHRENSLCMLHRRAHHRATLIACGIEMDSKAAAAAIRAGAKEYIPLPPDEKS